MDYRDRLKITRNLTELKERVGADLDPVLDKLIERDIFDIRIKVHVRVSKIPAIFLREILKNDVNVKEVTVLQGLGSWGVPFFEIF